MRIKIKESEKFAYLFEKRIGFKLRKLITGLCTDSRECENGDLYISIVGTKLNGNKFLPEVEKRGAYAALVSKKENNLNIQQIVVQNPKESIAKLANIWRNQFDIPVVAITGSNGKTSTKDLLVHVLLKKFKVHATKGNFNTSIGLPLTLLELTESDDISVIELGANKIGDIENLCKISNPTHGIITNIAPAHFEGFGSIDAIIKTKGALFGYLKNGMSFVNMADKEIASIKISGKKITFGKTPDCDFYANIQNQKNGKMTVKIDNKEILTISRNLSFIKNCIAVYAIAKTLGMEPERIKFQIKSFQTPPGRCQVKIFDKITVIDDTYNANLVSCIAALEYLKAFSRKGRKVFVFGDMLELGKLSTKQHIKVGEKCSELNLDLVYTFGTESKVTNNALSSRIHNSHFDSKSNLISKLKKDLKPGDNVLFKGSRGMAMDNIISEVFRT
tara:strand:+ start:5 stop:1345 length:1341 start_codon:yes stop_codon:yes gene_type:complete